MNIFHLLAFSPLAGGFWLLMLFAFSFFLVHLLLFAKAGWESKRIERRKPQRAETPPPPENKQPEPIYYIVEKKKKRPKSTYSSPREIHFQ